MQFIMNEPTDELQQIILQLYRQSMHSTNYNIWIWNLDYYDSPGTKTSKCPKGNEENNAW